MSSEYFDTPLLYLPGIGEKKAQLLYSELFLHTYEDLLYYFPYRYIDRTRIYTIGELRDDLPEIQIKGVLTHYVREGIGRKARLKAYLTDATGSVELVWFRNTQYFINHYPEDKEYIVFGKFKRFGQSYTIVHPEITPIEQAHTVTGGLMPMYRTTEKMKKSYLDSDAIRTALARICSVAHLYVKETLLPVIIEHYSLVPLSQALVEIHFPKNTYTLNKAKERLKFDELFYLQLSLQLTKSERKARFKGYELHSVGPLFTQLYQSLPYELTDAQKRVLREIWQDTRTGLQMSRLVQGDVGSGKTLVALFAMLLAVDNGLQACMMAPTEILARQHFESLHSFVSPLGISIAVLTGSSSRSDRQQILSDLQSGQLSLLIGTHALIEEKVVFAHLGLAVIDEQHRFGVMQRARLWEKSPLLLPHILIMSATPIPRTLAMTLYGDLDVSIIDQLPPGRKPIKTYHCYDDEAHRVHHFLKEHIQSGQQAYVVYPMIEGTEESDYKNLETGYNQFVEMYGFHNVTWLHGKLKPQEKQLRMEEFVSGKVPILLSTTVIEVGVNVPNATLMIIENSDRFGLAQLHQLRGRVGRGREQSYCVLMSKRKISFPAQQRIEVMCATNDGFKIAEEDMRLRGAGDIEGTRQSGDFPGLKIAEPTRDIGLLQAVIETVASLLSKDPLLELKEHQLFLQQLEKLYPRDQQWGKIG